MVTVVVDSSRQVQALDYLSHEVRSISTLKPFSRNSLFPKCVFYFAFISQKCVHKEMLHKLLLRMKRDITIGRHFSMVADIVDSSRQVQALDYLSHEVRSISTLLRNSFAFFSQICLLFRIDFAKMCSLCS